MTLESELRSPFLPDTILLDGYLIDVSEGDLKSGYVRNTDTRHSCLNFNNPHYHGNNVNRVYLEAIMHVAARSGERNIIIPLSFEDAGYKTVKDFFTYEELIIDPTAVCKPLKHMIGKYFQFRMQFDEWQESNLAEPDKQIIDLKFFDLPLRFDAAEQVSRTGLVPCWELRSEIVRY